MNTNTTTTSRFTTKRLVTMALFAAIICIAAYISIPLPLPGAPHITLQNFVIILIALLFPSLDAFLIVLVWMLLGIIGLPVFIGGGSGIAYLLMPYGGYTVVFPFVALLLPALCGKQYNRLRYTLVAILGAVLIDAIGMFRLMGVNGLTLTQGIATGFVPFITLDLVKCIVAAQIIPQFRKIIQ